MNRLKINIGDTVKVIAGSDKGVQGEVIQVKSTLPFRIKVRGVRQQTHFDKQKSQIYKKEGFIDYSNVSLVKKAEKKEAPTKTAKK